jgi:phosphate transport system ATP-binding protein
MNSETYAMRNLNERELPAKAQETVQPDEAAESVRMRVEGLSVYYGKVQAVKKVSMSIRTHKVTALIGPSGCGKSTFIRCLNRMHELTPGARVEGKILLDEQDLYGAGMDPVDVRRRVGMVFQKPNPFPNMSVRENVIAGFKLRGVRDPKVLDEVIEKSLRGAALWDEVKDNLQKSGSSISGGQQQRLCIARALAVQPEVLLMDEPCSALDPIATAKIEELVHELKDQVTIAIVTHNMQQAARCSDFTSFFYLGELIEFGETAKLFTAPEKRQTEDYITGRFG